MANFGLTNDSLGLFVVTSNLVCGVRLPVRWIFEFVWSGESKIRYVRNPRDMDRPTELEKLGSFEGRG